MGDVPQGMFCGGCSVRDFLQGMLYLERSTGDFLQGMFYGGCSTQNVLQGNLSAVAPRRTPLLSQ
jgi:hypothetical protein